MLKSKVEAILFLTDKPLRAQAIARIVNEDVQVVRASILDLIHDYEERGGGLEIADDDGYIIQVRDQYASIIDEFVPMEMPISLVRTLSAIAIKQPVAQSEIIKIRGAGAYEHIKDLVERELIVKKEDGRSPMLSTTKKFQEYFRLSQDAKSLRKDLTKQEKLEKELAAQEGAATAEQPQEQLVLEEVAGQLVAGSGDNPAQASVHTDQAESDGQSDEDRQEQAKRLELILQQSPDASLVYKSDTAADKSGGETAAQSSAKEDEVK
ncbi:MAG TPA: SMC-Scp complex subunit ScpB [Chroococcales cyanobacterium]